MVATPGTFNILAQNEIIGQVKFTGANDIGPALVVELNNVMFRPSEVVGLISDEWGQLQVAGEVLADDTGIFGTLTHPDTSLVSPLTSMYSIGKGIVSIQLTGESTFRDVGNVPVFNFTPNITTLPHFSSRYGVRTKDLEVVHEKSATLAMTMDEFTYENLKLVLMGEVATP